MRRVYRDIEIIKNSNNEDIGLNLSSDSCAEHEMGVKTLQNNLGISGFIPDKNFQTLINDVLNLEKEPTKDIVENVFEKTFKMQDKQSVISIVYDDGIDLAFIVAPRYLLIDDVSGLKQEEDGIYYGKGKMPDYIDRYTTSRNNASYYNEETKRHVYIKPGRTKASRNDFIEKTHGFQTAWSDRDFLIRARGDKERQVLTDIINNFKNNNLLVSVAQSSNPFSRGGLTLTDASKVSYDVKKQYLLDYMKKEEINNALKETNIEQILKDAKFSIYGIHAEWSDSNKENLLYFINASPPYSINNGKQISGWGTLQDLKELSKGKGYYIEPEIEGQRKGYINDAKDRLQEQLENKSFFKSMFKI
jgi:hypothetical protein